MTVLSLPKRIWLLGYLAVGVIVALWGHAHLLYFALWFVAPVLLCPLFLAGNFWAMIVV